MAPRSSTPTVVRITSAEKSTALSSFMAKYETTEPPVRVLPRRRKFRETDPQAKKIADLSPDDFGKRIVIRSGDFLGTVYGTILSVHAHRNLVHFTTVQLWQKKELTFRNDTEVVVLDDV